MNESFVSENGTKFFVCKSISTQVNQGPRNSIFAMPKRGLVKLRKDWVKFSYVMELYQANKLVESDSKTLKPTDVYLLKKKDIDIRKISKEHAVLSLKNGGCIKLDFEDSNDGLLFEKLLKRCLEDEHMLDGQIESDDVKLKLQESEKSKLVLDDIDKLGNEERESENKAKNHHLNIHKVNAKPHQKPNITALLSSTTTSATTTTTTTTTTTSNTSSTNFVSKRFYSNSNSSILINSRYNKENTENYDLQSSSSSKKRRHSPLTHDENSNHNNENLFNLSNISFGQQSPIPALTPKRNCTNYNSLYSSPSSANSFKSWNRNNSFGKSSGGKGFSNLGNTCYMNAILQCLLNIEIYSNDLIFTKQQLNDSLTPNCLYSSLCDLYKARESNNESLQIQALKEVKNAISQEAIRFSGHQQHDAHEFLCQVLDQLKEDIDKYKKQNELNRNNNNNNNDDKNENKINDTTNNVSPTVIKTTTTTTQDDVVNDVNKNNNANSDDNTHDNNTNSATTATTNTTTNTTSTTTTTTIMNPIVENFEFQVIHTIKCTQCNEIILKKEEFNNLCLELPNINNLQNEQISIQNALDIFFNDENVPFNCEKCRNNLVIIKHKFKKLPRLLILYLKRYQFEEGNNLKKNDCDVEIPLYLTLNTLCDVDLELPSKPMINIEQMMKLNNLDFKPIPLGTKELNQQQQQLRESKIASNSATKPSTTDSTSKPFVASASNSGIKTHQFRKAVNMKPFQRKGLFNENKTTTTVTTTTNFSSKLNDKTHNHFEDDFEELPQINEPNKFDNFLTEDTNFVSFDEKNYVIKDLSEEDQLRLALERSLDPKFSTNGGALNEEILFLPLSPSPPPVQKRVVNNIDTNTNKNNNKNSENTTNDDNNANYHYDVCINLDGNFDIDPDSENESHVVNTNKKNSNLVFNDDDDEYNNFKINEHKRKDLRVFSSRNRLAERNLSKKKENEALREKKKRQDDGGVEVLTRRSSSLNIEDPFSMENITETKPNNNKGFNKTEDDLLKQYITATTSSSNDNENKIENSININFSPIHNDLLLIDENKKLDDENSKSDKDSNSYRLIGIVSHLGHSSNSGHYICDVYDPKKQTWSVFDDNHVDKLSENQVLEKRTKTGYIFFYIHNTLIATQ